MQAYRIVCDAGCEKPRVVIGKGFAERGARSHHERTDHPVVVEPVGGGEALRFGGHEQ